MAMSQLIVAPLAKEPDQRPGAAQQVAEVLRSLEEGRDTIPDAVATTKPAIRRTLAVTLASVLVVGTFVWFLSGWFLPRSHDEPLAGSWSKAKPLTQARSIVWR